MRPDYLLILFFFLCPWSQVQAQRSERLCVMAYNVENLFDTEDDPRHADEDFLPEGDHHWTPARYRLKLEHLAEVISAVGDEDFPALIGLVEVENGQVLEDLLHKTPLYAQAGYRFLVTDGEDRRGINVALLYQPERFRLLAREELALHFPFDPAKRTRPLLHAMGIVPSGDTLHIVVCHLPSRRGGSGKSERYRRYATEQLRELAQRVLVQGGEHTHCLFLGDFNGEAEEDFLAQGLGVHCYPLARSEKVRRESLYALLHQRSGQRQFGSYCYQGCWSQLDQLILSGSLLQAGGSLTYEEGSGETVRHTFYMTETGQPWRTYGGTFYRGGYSDHFPVRLILRYRLLK